MDLATRINVLSILALAFAITGVVLVLTQGPLLTALGALLVISSAILFMADVADMIVMEERNNAKRRGTQPPEVD